nr:glycosyltransferase [uncultured Bacteroides sp.]
MNKEPIISVVMPVYNSVLFLKECIDSILNQTFKDFELIIIDDGSSDDSVEIIKSYSDARIKLVLSQHDYINSLNRGISMSRGKYIARMDSDDIMCVNRLERQYDFMEKKLDIDICGSAVKMFGRIEIEPRPVIGHNNIVSCLAVSCSLFHPSVIMRKNKIFSYYSKNGECILYDRNYIYAEDYRLWVDMAIKGFKFANIPDVLILYRLSDVQITSRHSKEMSEITRKIHAEFAEYIKGIILSNANEYYETYFNTSLDMFYRKIINKNIFLKIISSIYKKILDENYV